MKDTATPSLPITTAAAREALKQAQTTPRTVARPVVVVSGFADFGVPARGVARQLRAFFPTSQILTVSLQGCRSFSECRTRLIEAVNEAFPSPSADRTVPVDVVAISMGGLVSRYAAMKTGDGPVLSVHRLFTIATPHRGSRLARIPWASPLVRDMRPGSEFLARLDQARRPYPVIPYVRLGDEYTATIAAAPLGQEAWTVTYRGWLSAHNTSYRDARFLADIAVQLVSAEPSPKPSTKD